MGAVVPIATGVIAVHGQMQAEQAQQAQARHNAALARIAAQDARERGRVEEHRLRQRSGRLRGLQRATIAAGGAVVDVGSAEEAILETIELTEYDALLIRSNAGREAFGFESRASAIEARADALRAASRIATLGTIAGAAGQAFDAHARRPRENPDYVGPR